MGIKIGDWELDRVLGLGIGNCDWGLGWRIWDWIGIEIEIGDWGLGLGIWIGD